MKQNPKMISARRLKQIVARFREKRIMVVGDVMIDQYIWGRVCRVSSEAPVPVVDVTFETLTTGGAANTARNLQALGANAAVMGVVGPDAMGERLEKLLAQENIATQGLLEDEKRHTTIKTRIVAHQQQVVRYDRETRTELPAWLTKLALDHLHEAADEMDAIIVADYAKGFVTQPLYDGIVKMTQATNKILSVDPKPRHSMRLHDMTVATPNRAEVFAAAGHTDSLPENSPLRDHALLRAGEMLFHRWRPQILVLTLGEHGLCLMQRDKGPVHIPTVAREIFDVSGAGDTVIAAYTLALTAGATPLEAAIISNHAAGVVVGKFGTATVSLPELVASFDRTRKQ